jgi:hypothetical protein
MNISIDELKKLHDIYAVTHQVLTQKATFHHEEFEFIDTMVKFYKEQIVKLKEEILEKEKLEAEAQKEADGKDQSEN